MDENVPWKKRRYRWPENYPTVCPHCGKDWGESALNADVHLKFECVGLGRDKEYPKNVHD